MSHIVRDARQSRVKLEGLNEGDWRFRLQVIVRLLALKRHRAVLAV
jgi:hypothetical protein